MSHGFYVRHSCELEKVQVLKHHRSIQPKVPRNCKRRFFTLKKGDCLMELTNAAYGKPLGIRTDIDQNSLFACFRIGWIKMKFSGLKSKRGSHNKTPSLNDLIELTERTYKTQTFSFHSIRFTK
jgi:hypothetical protein